MSMEFYAIYPGGPGNTGKFKTYPSLDEACDFAAEAVEIYGSSRIETTGDFCQFPSFPWQKIFEQTNQGTKWLLGGAETSEEAVRAFLAKYAEIGGQREAKVKASAAYKELQDCPFAGMLLPFEEGLPPVTAEEKAMAKEIYAMKRVIEEGQNGMARK